ncbi:hypothetical protein LEP48_16940 [Isoptericola sp. NEAU-Y5]|uniref:Uncharacterized protein n=1 Tax=Isoptericola luteus TaxID=2879484 RepID=A0ABS7ZJC7_9MICO|nr:hypothetical protein [Isoptericola sp. NEAU-Y5]MCA5895018.1 hypothetical protein [Isoptericola sp. NEAU-Y5]
MIRPRWEWSLVDAEGQAAPAAPSPVFTTQYDAEQWLGEQWRELAATGVAVVRLLHDGTQATPSIELPAP